MRRLSLFLLSCALLAPAGAAAAEDWHVLKRADGVYAYDASDVEEGPRKNVKTVWVYVGTPEGWDRSGFFVDCRTNHGEFIGTTSSDDHMIMAEGNANPREPGWVRVPRSGRLRVAADVACGWQLGDAISVESRDAALGQLKTLSN